MDNDARRGRGRPRRWASSAERSRAYRARKKRELSEPAALRSEVRNLRQELRAARRDLDTYQRRSEQLEQELTRASRRGPTAAATGTSLSTVLTQKEQAVGEAAALVQGELFALAPIPIVPRGERA